MLIPKDPRKKGVVIEFKKVYPATDETLEHAAKKALDQVIAKNYVQELAAKGIHDTIAYGIAFAGKKVHVDSRVLN